MGIKGLMRLLADNAAAAIRYDQIKNYFGRKIAIDGTMSIYQFLISIRGTGLDLTDESGMVTSHLQGIFYRTIKMMTMGIKPIYVFDGKPPEMKSAELKKRKKRQKEAIQKEEEAKETGTEEERIKFFKRSVRVSKAQIEECKKLLTLMGVPVITSPTEAEAQCAEMVKAGLVYGTGTEDMDALTFGSNVLIRHLATSKSKEKKVRNPIKEISLPKVLECLRLSMDEFIDLCILCGCDYCDGIRGIGPVKAFKFITKYRSIERILPRLKGKKGYVIPPDFLQAVESSRRLFKKPDVMPANELRSILKWEAPKEKELIQYMVVEKKFDEKRVVNGINRLKKARRRGTQGRMTDFFKKPKSKLVPPPPPGKSEKKTGKKRKRSQKSKSKKGKSSKPPKKKRKRK